jgi:lactobin A/cerein 7B family class IIb bacteriocin
MNLNIMKHTQLEGFGFVELTNSELEETNGGFLPLLIIGVVLLAGCSSQNNRNTGSGTQISVQCTNCNVTVKKDTVIATKK